MQNPNNGDAAYCGAALHRSVVEPLAEPDNLEYGDAAH